MKRNMLVHSDVYFHVVGLTALIYSLAVLTAYGAIGLIVPASVCVFVVVKKIYTAITDFIHEQSETQQLEEMQIGMLEEDRNDTRFADFNQKWMTFQGTNVKVNYTTVEINGDLVDIVMPPTDEQIQVARNRSDPVPEALLADAPITNAEFPSNSFNVYTVDVSATGARECRIVGGGFRLKTIGVIADHLYNHGELRAGKTAATSIPITDCQLPNGTEYAVESKRFSLGQNNRGADIAFFKLKQNQWSAMKGVKQGYMAPIDMSKPITAFGVVKLQDGTTRESRSIGKVLRTSEYPAKYELNASSQQGWCGHMHMQRYRNRDCAVGVHCATQYKDGQSETQVNLGIELGIFTEMNFFDSDMDNVMGYKREQSYSDENYQLESPEEYQRMVRMRERMEAYEMEREWKQEQDDAHEDYCFESNDGEDNFYVSGQRYAHSSTSFKQARKGKQTAGSESSSFSDDDSDDFVADPRYAFEGGGVLTEEEQALQHSALIQNHYAKLNGDGQQGIEDQQQELEEIFEDANLDEAAPANVEAIDAAIEELEVAEEESELEKFATMYNKRGKKDYCGAYALNGFQLAHETNAGNAKTLADTIYRAVQKQMTDAFAEDIRNGTAEEAAELYQTFKVQQDKLQIEHALAVDEIETKKEEKLQAIKEKKIATYTEEYIRKMESQGVRIAVEGQLGGPSIIRAIQPEDVAAAARLYQSKGKYAVESAVEKSTEPAMPEKNPVESGNEKGHSEIGTPLPLPRMSSAANTTENYDQTQKSTTSTAASKLDRQLASDVVAILMAELSAIKQCVYSQNSENTECQNKASPPCEAASASKSPATAPVSQVPETSLDSMPELVPAAKNNSQMKNKNSNEPPAQDGLSKTQQKKQRKRDAELKNLNREATELREQLSSAAKAAATTENNVSLLKKKQEEVQAKIAAKQSASSEGGQGN
jgi:hypothetical protein